MITASLLQIKYLCLERIQNTLTFLAMLKISYSLEDSLTKFNLIGI